jgi:hypothetical protein
MEKMQMPEAGEDGERLNRSHLPSNHALPGRTPQVSFIRMGDDFIEAFPDAIANFVSCTGVKRNSTNHRLKRTFPAYAMDYKRRCLRKHLVVGEAYPFDLGTMFGTRVIISLPIKAHWRELLQPAQVRSALSNLVNVCNELGIESLAVPLFEGPPAEWIESKLREDLTRHPKGSIKTIFLFREE